MELSKTYHLARVAVLLFVVLMTGCQPNEQAIISGKLSSDIKEVLIGKQVVAVESGGFHYSIEIESGTILTLKVLEDAYEVYIEPGKTIQLDIKPETISFDGDLISENNHLLSDKEVVEQMNPFLRNNWYSIHTKGESKFIAIIDSLKEQLLNSMDESTLSKEFIDINSASVNYGFDRLTLRYPGNYNYFKGAEISLSKEVLEAFEVRLDIPEHRHLDSYQKFAKTLLDQKISEATYKEDTTTYWGAVRLNTSLKIIEDVFQSTVLRDRWSFEYIKSHFDEYTWINGKEYLDTFISNCSTPSILEEAMAFKKEQLAEREGHEILVYKTVKGQTLEAHVFRPEKFDQSKKYPALAAFHGGGWISGNAGWAFSSAEHAAENGMIGISVEYRLSNRVDVTPKEAMEDTRDLISWLRENADAMNIISDKIIAKGISAGGHLVSSIAVLHEEASSLPNALVLVSPALDTSDEYFRSLLERNTEYATLSSVGNLKAGLNMPPTLILQGRTDNLTPTKYAMEFKNKMDSLGYQCELEIYENVGHLFTPSHLDDTGFPQSDPEVSRLAFDRQIEFLMKLAYIQ